MFARLGLRSVSRSFDACLFPCRVPCVLAVSPVSLLVFFFSHPRSFTVACGRPLFHHRTVSCRRFPPLARTWAVADAVVVGEAAVEREPAQLLQAVAEQRHLVHPAAVGQQDVGAKAGEVAGGLDAAVAVRARRLRKGAAVHLQPHGLPAAALVRLPGGKGRDRKGEDMRRLQRATEVQAGAGVVCVCV